MKEQTAPRKVDRLGELLVRSGLVSPEALKEALRRQRRYGGRLGEQLVAMGVIDQRSLAQFLARQYGFPYVDLQEETPQPEALRLIPPEIAQRYQLLPLREEGEVLVVAVADPSDPSLINDLQFITGRRVRLVVASAEDIRRALDLHHRQASEELWKDLPVVETTLEEEPGGEELGVEELRRATEEAPIVRLTNFLLSEAIDKGASDIHIEPYEDDLRVRFRIDGVLRKVMSPPKRLHPALVSRLKVMSRLDISERRLPQDGRMRVRYRGREVDFRTSFVPTLFGEKVVIRVLDRSGVPLNLEGLGFDPVDLEKLQWAIRQPHGMILVTGPTGSGKSTTLYAVLNQLNEEGVNIMTAEDPVEFYLRGINQVQVSERIGLDFAACLRAFLRQDPDVIMVGEIRDLETADIAVKAALTGHLVLSTLHTNDAPSAPVRLIDMGVEPFLVSSCLLLVVAQRLARRVCPHCRREVEAPPELLAALGLEEEARGFRYFRGEGCKQCNFTGYRGRVAISEMLVVRDQVREAILHRASGSELMQVALAQGMRRLREDGIQKVRQGVTTLEEVLRVTAEG